MSEIRAVIVNLDEFRKKLNELGEVARGEALKAAARAGGHELEAEIKLHIESQSLVDTGNLLNSVQIQKERYGPGGGEVWVGPGDVPYAAIYEFGGVILPRRAKVLRFIGEDGKPHFIQKRVVEARPYIRPAVDEGKKRIVEAIRVTIKNAIDKVKP